MKKIYGLPTVGLVFLALTWWAWHQIAPVRQQSAFVWRMPLDLAIYLKGGAEVAQGQPLYDGPLIYDLPFTYPPFAGVVFAGLDPLSDNATMSLWHGATFLALFAVVTLALRERGLRLGVLGVVVFLVFTLTTVNLEPIHGTAFYGQINVFLMFLVALDFLPRKFRLAGIGTGLAAGLKLTPAYMGLIFVIQRRWWHAVICVLTFLTTVVVGLAVVGDGMRFWTESMFESSRVGAHSNPGAQALRSVLERAFGVAGGPVWLGVVVAVFVLTCAAVALASRSGNNTLALAFTGLSSCLVSPFSWYHHFVWVVPLAIGFFAWINQTLGRRWRGTVLREQVVGLISVAGLCLVLAPFVGERSFPWFAYRTLDGLEATWPTLIFSCSPIVFMLVYVIYRLIPRTQVDEGPDTQDLPVITGRHRAA